jgi:hypothetical protein
MAINAKASDVDYYTTVKSKELTKVEAMKKLILSENKDKVYRCRQVKVSDKGTVTYK